MKKFLSSLFTWRTARWAAYLLAALITLIALFYTIENWRGARAWAAAKAKLEAADINIDYHSLFPDPVPDEENLAATPTFLAMLLTYEDSDKKHTNPLAPYEDGLLALAIEDTSTDCRLGQSFDASQAWEAFLKSNPDANPQSTTAKPAEKLLWQFTRFQPIIRELHEARHRPHFTPEIIPADLPPDISLPHISIAISLVRFLHAHAEVSLAAGQTEPAAVDIETIFRFSEGVISSPFLVSVLAGQAMVTAGLDSLWQGLEQNAFNQLQLIRLQDELTKLDLLEAYEKGIQCELVGFSIATADAVRDDREKAHWIFNVMDPAHDKSQRQLSNFCSVFFLGMYFGPNGWYDQFKAESASIFQEHYLASVDLSERRVHPIDEDQMEEYFTEVKAKIFTTKPWQWMIAFHVPALSNVVNRTAETQTQVDLAIIALGLERYRQDHEGQYPEKLDALAPDYLPAGWAIPHDLFTGNPLHYRRVPEKSTYLLYATGPNQIDDGGTTYDTRKTGPDSPRYNRRATNKHGDWVWPTPAMTIKPKP